MDLDFYVRVATYGEKTRKLENSLKFFVVLKPSNT